MTDTKKTQIALDVKGLKKTYHSGTKALRGVDLQIKSGQFFGLLGPNGAGKSTLIHTITGLSMPTKGSAKVFGSDVVDDYKAARMYVGLSPQDINLDWFLTVEQTLDFHGGYYGMRKKERQKRIDELLKIFSLTDKKDSRGMFLSGGMKRRMVIARALMHRPEFLILDEPTAGVDVELRRELWEYVRKINEQGTTILLTTHYIEEAEALCDQIALIDNGKILNQGTAAQLRKIYKAKTLEDVYLKATGKKGEA
ncbi:MAG: ABC transporter ATP-binding protein [Patescibacteria group bacterium]